MRLIFRTNASTQVGLGHLSRCLSLVSLFKKHNHEIYIDKFNDKIFKKYKNINLKFIYNNNSFINEIEDAKKFTKHLSLQKNDYVFLDDYRLSYKWEKYVSKFCKKLICIDDFIHRKHYVDIYINTKPDFINKKKSNIILLKNNNKNKCKFLLGPSYYIPRIELKKIKERKKNKKFNLTFYNGGSGNILIYKKIIKVFLKKKIKNIKINLIVGPLSNNISDIKKNFKKKEIKIYYNHKNFYKILNNTNLLVASAGIISYEAAYLNIPTILIKTVRNQDNLDNNFEKIGHFFVLEKYDILQTKKFVNLILNLKNNQNRINKLIKYKKINIKTNIKKLRNSILYA